MRIMHPARTARSPLVHLALAAAVVAGAPPALADSVPFTPTSSLWSEAFGTVPADVRAIVTAPVDHPKAVGTAVAVVGALVLFDKPITTLYQNTIEKAFSHFALPAAPISWPQYGIVSEDVWLLSGVAGTYAYGALAHDDRAQRAGLLSAKAVAYSYFVSELAIKTIFARKRPYPDLNNPAGNSDQYTDDPYDFFNWSGSFLSLGRSGRSMPSYHFTEYFSVARVFSGIYDNSPIALRPRQYWPPRISRATTTGSPTWWQARSSAMASARSSSPTTAPGRRDI